MTIFKVDICDFVVIYQCFYREKDKMEKNGIIRILIIVFAVLDAIVLIGGSIYLITASKKINSLQLTANFADTEISINNQYSFSVTANPDKASLKKVKAICDDPSATFEIDKEGNAVLTTGASEGTVSLYVEYKDIKSNVLTFSVVDIAARAQAEAEAAAQAAAEAEAAAAAEAEAAAAAEAAAVKVYVKMTGDNVNVRAQNNTDCDILGKAMKGDTFEKVEVIDDWTHIIYNGQDGYIKSEYLTEVSADEAAGGADTASTEQATQTEEKKEDTSAEDAAKKAAEEAAAKQAQEDAAKKAAEDAAAQAAAELQAQQEALAAQQAAAAAAAAAGPTLECADGVHTFTAAQYNFLKGFWYREGQTSEDDWKVYAHKHTYAECIQICQIEGGL